MIKSEIITINETQYQKTYSDAGYYIERDGAEYTEAIDPIGTGREYTETDKLIEADEDAADISTRLENVENQAKTNASDIEYIAMMTDIELDA